MQLWLIVEPDEVSLVMFTFHTQPSRSQLTPMSLAKQICAEGSSCARGVSAVTCDLIEDYNR